LTPLTLEGHPSEVGREGFGRDAGDTEGLRSNPDALPDAAPPRVGRYRVNGTTLYAEIRGAGPAVLIVHGGAEDAEHWRPLAERLTGFTVVTYDRRGTLRSGRGDWPGGGSNQHADDAAALLDVLGLAEATLFGGSSGGNVALRLALRHPDRTRLALVWEPGFFAQVPEGHDIHRPDLRAAADALSARPDDWPGAYAAVIQAILAQAGLDTTEKQEHGHFAKERSWHSLREEGNAEPFVRDDVLILTRETVDEAELAAATSRIRFSCSEHPVPILRAIVDRLAAARGEVPDRVQGVGHTAYLEPQRIADYIRAATNSLGP
jgi:pimeloyl-ACP methyl ester carboxylesterase